MFVGRISRNGSKPQNYPSNNAFDYSGSLIKTSTLLSQPDCLVSQLSTVKVTGTIEHKVMYSALSMVKISSVIVDIYNFPRHLSCLLVL